MNASPNHLDAIAERCRYGREGFECHREGSGHRLLIWGRLPPQWSANLTLHLSAMKFGVVTADGARMEDGSWGARFFLRAPRPMLEVEQDFLLMARRAPRAIPLLPAARVSVSTRPSGSEAGTFYARVTGEDSIGLLAELLRRFERFGLRPRRFSLRTVDDQVDDWFWLESIEDCDRQARTAALGGAAMARERAD